MKKILFLILMSVLTFNAVAQKTRDFSKYEHKHAFHKPWIGNNAFLTQYAKSCSDEYAVPVKFYVFGKENAPTEQDIKETLQNLNSVYKENNTRISFYLSELKFIKKKKFDKFGYYGQFPWQSFWRHDRNVMNVFLVSRLKKPGKKNKNIEYTGACNNLNGTVIISSRNDASVIAHEVGHYLGLRHPHKNSDKGKHRQESVDRDVFRGGLFVRGRNCEINGDGLSDTEAQPHLVKHTDRNCNYTSPDLTDLRGKKYTPQLDNIMSYTTGKQCRRNFTPMQKAVMLYTVSKKKNSEKWKNAQTFPDSYEPDGSVETATILKDKILQEHYFHRKANERNPEYQESDYFKFTISKKVNTAKSKIVISGGADLTVRLYFEEKDGMISTKNEYHKTAGEKLAVSLDGYAPGTYYAETQGVSGSYSITLDLDKPIIKD